jgi:hypothetical protein
MVIRADSLEPLRRTLNAECRVPAKGLHSQSTCHRLCPTLERNVRPKKTELIISDKQTIYLTS